MKRIVFAFAALAAFQAAAITATKEYVDRRDTEIRTNTYTKAETDARIAASRITTNDVCEIVTKEAAEYTTNDTWECNIPAGQGWCPVWRGSGWVMPVVDVVLPSDATIYILKDEASPEPGLGDFVFTRIPAGGTRNALGLARMSDIAPSVSNTVTRAYVEDLGIESGIQEETDPVWSSEKGNYATKQNVTVVSNLAASADTKANTLISYVNGDDVMDVVTNYDSAVHISSRSLRQRVEDGGTNYWRVVWDEMNRWNWFLPQIDCQTNALWNALSEKADRAWGFYDSHTGGWSPDGYLQISSPKILVAAGMAYQRHVTTGGAVWVLESNGLVTEVCGVASNGFFRISDDDGNALFEIVKGNKRTVGSTAGGITLTNIMGITHCYIPYNVDAPKHPTIYATAALGTPFVSEESAGSLVNVTWTGTRGDYHAEVWPKTASSSLFINAKHETGGETYIKNTAPTGLEGGIMLNGTKYSVGTAVISGKTVLTLEVP